MLQRCKPCQDKAIEQTFVVDNSRLLSLVIGYNIDFQYVKFNIGIVLFSFTTVLCWN